MKLNLRNRFLLPTSAALLVAFIGYLSITTYKTGDALESTVIEEMHQLEKLVLGQVDNWLAQRDQDVGRWSELPSIQSAVDKPGSPAAAEAEAVLLGLSRRAEYYEGLHLIGADGVAVASSVSGSTGKLNVATRDYFVECKRSGQPVISQPLESKVTGKPIIVVCYPVNNENGRQAGAVLGVVSLGKFTEGLIDPIKIGKTGYAYICASDGTFLAHPKKELVLTTKITDWDFGKKLMAQKQGHMEYDFKGVRKQATFSTDERTGWLVAVTIDNSQIYAEANALRNFGILITLVSVLLVSGVIFLVARSVTGPINNMMANINAGSEQTTSVATQIADASVQLAEQSSEQAAAVEETSASLEEMAANVKNTADSADRCQGLMNETRQAVEQGLTSMEAMVEAIDTIKNSADQTARIVGTIDEIAFQTNLLALNAAVEAARAGDAGKGFAVVAEEVRNLAQRAAEAAKETSSLIDRSLTNAENGVHVTQQSRSAFQATADNANQVAEQVDSIATAAREQSDGIDQINQAIGQLDQTTQSAAANAEESASAAEELNAQAAQLSSVVAELHALISGEKRHAGQRFDMRDQDLHALADQGADAWERHTV